MVALGNLVRRYLLLAVSNLLPSPKVPSRTQQLVWNSSLPNTCTAPNVLPYLAQLPNEWDGWRQAFGLHQRQQQGRPAPGSIIDISMALHAHTPSWDSATGLGAGFRVLESSQQQGDDYTGSMLTMSAHTGTHVDSPGHFVWPAYASGQGTESLDLTALNGPCLVVESRRNSNLTASVLQSLDIPQGTTRVLFKTLNTQRGLHKQVPFDSSYLAFTREGAQWLVQHRPSIRLIGVDYLSVAVYEDVVGPHVELLGHGKIVVEGLVLDEVPPGLYTVHCLPLKVAGSDGAPTRCILIA